MIQSGLREPVVARHLKQVLEFFFLFYQEKEKIRSIFNHKFIPILILSSIYINNFFLLSNFFKSSIQRPVFSTTPYLDRISNNPVYSTFTFSTFGASINSSASLWCMEFQRPDPWLIVTNVTLTGRCQSSWVFSALPIF